MRLRIIMMNARFLYAFRYNYKLLKNFV